MAAHKPSLYLDTNIFSVLHYRGGLVELQNQQIVTREWWDIERLNFNLFASAVVEDELEQGVYPGKAKAVAMVRRLPFLPMRTEVVTCKDLYLEHRLVPSNKLFDAAHLALASVHGIDYLMTWNQTHLANLEIQERLKALNARMGYENALACHAHVDSEVYLWSNASEEGNVKKGEAKPDGPEVARIRKVRDQLVKRYKTFDALWAHWLELDKQHRAQINAKRKRVKKAPVLPGHKRAS